MILVFELSMPNVNTWNGSWSGAGKIFARTRTLPNNKKQGRIAQQILDNQPYRYNFGDGWTAMVKVYSTDSKEAAKIRRNSEGFLGYDWMIESIKNALTIHPDYK